MMRRTIALGLLLLGSVGSGTARGQEGEAEEKASGFEATGAAPVQADGGDVVRARERALADAMQRALEMAVLQAAPEARGRLYLVSGRARQYVTSFRVLFDGESAGQFQVRINAQIDVPRLLRDLRPAGGGRVAAAGRTGRPLLVCSVAAGAAPSDALSEAAALQAVREELGTLAALAPAAGCPAAAGAAAVTVTEVSRGAAPVAVRGTLPALQGASMRVGLTLTGPAGEQTQEAAESFGFGETAEAALQAAARQAAQRAAAALTPRLRALGWGASSSGTALQMTLEGVPSYGAYQTLLRTVAALPGVQGVEPQRFSARDSLAGLAVVPSTEGNVAGLGALLARTPVAGLRLQVMPQEGNRLRVLVAAASAVPEGVSNQAPTGGVAPRTLPAAPGSLPAAPSVGER